MTQSSARGHLPPWRPWPSVVDPDENDIHVWMVRTAAVDITGAARVLDASEWARAQRFARPDLERHFVALHLATRAILAACLDASPSDVAFSFCCAVCGGLHGKPQLRARNGGGADLEFNISAAGEVALVAVARRAQVGVDIEALDRDIEAAEVLPFLAHSEQDDIARLDEPERRRAILDVWTRKEAYSKMLGVGLSLPLDAYAVTVPPTPPAVVKAAPRDLDTSHLASLPVPPGSVATVAWQGSPRALVLWRW